MAVRAGMGTLVGVVVTKDKVREYIALVSRGTFKFVGFRKLSFSVAGFQRYGGFHKF